MSTTPQKPVLTEAAALPVELLTALVALLVLVLAACVGWCLNGHYAFTISYLARFPDLGRRRVLPRLGGRGGCFLLLVRRLGGSLLLGPGRLSSGVL